jgi:ankyrin repeat protein
MVRRFVKFVEFVRFVKSRRFVGPVGVALALALPISADERDLRLIEAVQRRDDKAFDTLLRAKADVNAAQPDGATALAWAVHLGQRRMAEALLDAGARPNTSDEYGESPLTLAAANGDTQMMQRLLAAGARADAARWNGETALMIAAGAGSLEAVRLLVFRGADVNVADPRRGQTPLMWAAAEGHTDVVKGLIEIGADTKIVSKSGFNALAFAVAKNDVESVKSLLATGLDPNLVLPSGNKLLMMAMAYRHSASAAALVDAGAAVHETDRSGNTPLHMAAQVGDIELVTKLIGKGADPNARTPKAMTQPGRGGGGGRGLAAGGSITPLMTAARANNLDVMKALVAGGADPALRADSGTTLLMFAAGGKVETVRYAYELDPHVDVVNASGQTPMHAAVSGGVARTQDEVCEVVQFLADKGARLDEIDKNGRTAITIADVAPIDKAVDLLTALIIKSGTTPKIPSKR